jgi:hypothetical protein
VVGQISSFGVDAAGELYVVCLGAGVVVSLQSAPQSTPLMFIDTPSAGSTVGQPFTISGWALDRTASTTGISTLHVWAYPQSGGAPQFLGVTTYGIGRPDVGAVFGAQFADAGFQLSARGLAPGNWTIVVYGWVVASQGFHVMSGVQVVVQPSALIAIESPAPASTVDQPFLVGGWAIDFAALSGTGIATIHVWAFPSNGIGPPVFIGVPAFFDRPDVAAVFGNQFHNAGYHVAVTTLPAGTWDFLVFAMSSVSGAFDMVNSVRVNLR